MSSSKEQQQKGSSSGKGAKDPDVERYERKRKSELVQEKVDKGEIAVSEQVNATVKALTGAAA